MPQLSLYIDDSTMGMLRSAARGSDMSMSKFVSGLIVDHAQHGAWPRGYWEKVYGSLSEDLAVTDEVLDPSLDDDCGLFE